jgi:hypothetical protein
MSSSSRNWKQSAGWSGCIRLDLLAGKRISDTSANPKTTSNLQRLRRKPDLNRDHRHGRPCGPRQSGSYPRARPAVNKIEPTDSMTRPAKLGLKKSQPGSEAIEVRAGVAKKREKQQQPRRTSSAMIRSIGNSPEINYRATEEALERAQNRLPHSPNRFHGPKQIPIALNQNRTAR